MRSLIDILELSVEEIDELLRTAEDIIANPDKYSEKCRGKNMSTEELADWIGKLVTAHTIEEALNVNKEDDSNPSKVGNESSSVIMEVNDE